MTTSNLPVQSAADLQQQGIQLYDRQEYMDAIRAFEQAKAAFEEADQPDMAAEMTVNIGLVRRSLGENQQALEMMQEALHVFEEMGDKLRMAQVHGNMGGVYALLDEKENALAAYREASNLFLEEGEQQMYAETMLAIGNLKIRSGKLIEGAAAYQVGLEDLDDLSTRQKILKKLTQVIAKLGGYIGRF